MNVSSLHLKTSALDPLKKALLSGIFRVDLDVPDVAKLHQQVVAVLFREQQHVGIWVQVGMRWNRGT